MTLSGLFDIRYGQKQFHNKENLDRGESLVISSQATDNGCYGFFDIKPKFKPPFITVPSTGSIGYAFVQLTEAGVADDALVLKPLDDYPTEYLFYVCAVIRGARWRYNYGRKITPDRLGKLSVCAPKNFNTQVSYSRLVATLYPTTAKQKLVPKPPHELRIVRVTDFFDLERGQFHAIDRLENGDCLTISRVSTDNGLVGFYKKPRKAILYRDHCVTVSTVTGDAFVQFIPFIATDNVLVCKPKKPLRITTLLYIQTVINTVKWRYSYGRQPYRRVFQKTVLRLPYDRTGNLDEDYMEALLKSQPYWNDFKVRCLSGGE